ncbi:MAG: glutamate-5-semialdehyde dehydrogenase [Spirochaetes bacterium]|nr:glutamate-5-semialdehyde dehydrogenase [Spirochaetota bacterium]
MNQNSINVRDISKASKESAIIMQSVQIDIRNKALIDMAAAVRTKKGDIINANKQDLITAKKDLDDGKISMSLYKRLILDDNKIEDMAIGLESICNLEDPTGKILEKTELDTGLVLSKVSCPIGLLGIIFESRPDVVPQIMGLTVKSGNTVVFKGGREAVNSNRMLFNILYDAGVNAGLPEFFSGLIETRDDVSEMLKLDEYYDLLIPRGSNALVKMIMENTKIPVLGHADGICTLYIDKDADPEKAFKIALDSKTQYPAVCNAIENLLINRDFAEKHFTELVELFVESGVELRGDEESVSLVSDIKPAAESDWSTEYNDMILSVKIVSQFEEAVAFINKYGSGHTDAIVTNSPRQADLFKKTIDSSSVMINASTRFADGFRYGKGAEIGISTNKTHARGPVGLEGLVIYKYFLEGNGHIVKDYSGEKAKPFTHKRLK